MCLQLDITLLHLFLVFNPFQSGHITTSVITVRVIVRRCNDCIFSLIFTTIITVYKPFQWQIRKIL